MSKLMKKPDSLDKRHLKESYFTGQQVKNKFYNIQFGYGSMTVDYIPQELKDKKWVPDIDKIQECHWYYTNPADPMDPGEDILVYIEEVSNETVTNLKNEYIKRIDNVISRISLENMKELAKYLEKVYGK